MEVKSSISLLTLLYEILLQVSVYFQTVVIKFGIESFFSAKFCKLPYLLQNSKYNGEISHIKYLYNSSILFGSIHLKLFSAIDFRLSL